MTTSIAAEPARLEAGLTGWRRTLVWAVAGVVIAATPIAVALMGNPASLDGFLAIGIGLTMSLAGVGGLIATRQPANAVGWLLLVAGIVVAVNLAGTTYVVHSMDQASGPLPGTALIAWVASWSFVPAIALVGVYVPVLFPTGRPPSPRLRWRLFMVAAAASLVIAQIPTMFGVGPLADVPELSNPFGFLTLGDAEFFKLVNFGSAALAFPVAFAAPVIRYRRGGPIERQQLKWLGWVGGATLSMLLLTVVADPTNSQPNNPVSDFGWIMFLVGVALIPVSIGIAILRYRLYEIDRIVSRTIAYALVTGGLLLVYLVVNLALTSVFSTLTRGGSVAVAASTLVVAALFTPVRRRVQRIVDRRFDRARYDAERTTLAFSERLRDEVDLTAVANDLDETVRASIAPVSVGVWLRAGQR